MKQFTKRQKEDFDRIATELIRWLNKNTHPQCTIVVDCNHAEVLEGVMVVNINQTGGNYE